MSSVERVRWGGKVLRAKCGLQSAKCRGWIQVISVPGGVEPTTKLLVKGGGREGVVN